MRAFLATLVAVLPTAALAQPPSTGATHTFYDPVFAGTIICDTLEQVETIVDAAAPEQAYHALLTATNDINEPKCAAMITTGLVIGVTSVGVMKRDNQHFNAWAVETQFGDVTAFALYLEHFEVVYA
jgi:hypothetical protein